MHKVFKYILINRFYLPRNIRAIIIITFFILLLPTEYIIGNLGIGNVIAVASSSSSINSSSYTEPINYSLSLLHVIVSKEYISSFSTSNYSGYVVSNANGWVVMNNTNYTFTYFGKACYNNYTFDTIQLINVTYDGDILIKIIYNITLINIPKSNGIDSVAKITRTYVIIRGIEPESETTTTQFYWFNYTKSEIGNNEYNISFNGYVEGIKAKGYVVEDPSSNSIIINNGSINVVGNDEMVNATVISDNKIEIYTNNSDPPAVANFTLLPVYLNCPWGIVTGEVAMATVQEGLLMFTSSALEVALMSISTLFLRVAGIPLAFYIHYYFNDYENFVQQYSINGYTTIYLISLSSLVKVGVIIAGICVWSGYIPSGNYWETGAYYNGVYYPFTNNYLQTIGIPNYNYGIYEFEQPHATIIPPSPFSPPWFGLWFS
ncbi:hypothetical protein EWF20_07415 [Sulfolobus sp. S-194]|uniref:hypothetical protein n=1 Tax=Sulfolobus sp. S-194 TaxID=2512240 RepID=UPI001436F89D|nr:hypothetical protein [Sulfolobus sp. S-194]QIW23996.1 hypothetical protein EWF20_07415 [Sulfolobus sp. S-194]